MERKREPMKRSYYGGNGNNNNYSRKSQWNRRDEDDEENIDLRSSDNSDISVHSDISSDEEESEAVLDLIHYLTEYYLSNECKLKGIKRSEIIDEELTLGLYKLSEATTNHLDRLRKEAEFEAREKMKINI